MSPDQIPKPYFTKASLAREWDLTERTIHNFIQRGWLQAYRLGVSVRIKPEDAEAFLEARRIKDE